MASAVIDVAMPTRIYYKQSKNSKTQLVIPVFLNEEKITHDVYAATPIVEKVSFGGDNIFQLTFFKNTIKISNAHNFFNLITFMSVVFDFENKCFGLYCKEFFPDVKPIVMQNFKGEGFDGKGGLYFQKCQTPINFVNYADVRLWRYKLKFVIKDWKNMTFNYRQAAEKFVSNMLGMLTGTFLKSFKLKQSECELKMKLNEDGDSYDKAFCIYFATLDPLFRNDLFINYYVDDKTHHFNCDDFLKFACKDINDLHFSAKIGDVSLKPEKNNIIPPYVVHNTQVCCRKANESDDEINLIDNVSYLDSPMFLPFDGYMYLKPNGIRYFDLFLNLMKDNYFKPLSIKITYPTDEFIKYFYPNAINYQYGHHWYNYLKQNKMILIHYQTDLTQNAMNQVKAEFRKQSGLNWTLNVVHMPVDVNEFIHFKNFYDHIGGKIPEWHEIKGKSYLEQYLDDVYIGNLYDGPEGF
jgi:hypothetical protein